jgi:D-arabinose 1-dehydrogenase-like Zn-dependent alcohol dehydrogenase
MALPVVFSLIIAKESYTVQISQPGLIHIVSPLTCVIITIYKPRPNHAQYVEQPQRPLIFPTLA